MVILGEATFGALDWVVLGGYFALLIVMGVVFSRREPEGADEYFLAGRQMPVWAVAVSVLATSLSAATFIGGPYQSFQSNLTYLSANIGGILAIVVVAVVFIPAFYRENVTTVYDLLERRFGTEAKRAASGMFMVGRVLASGVRLYIVGLPSSLVVFGDTSPVHMVLAIGVLTTIATLYTLVGGIRSIIWTDVIQTCVFVGAALAAVAVLLHRIPVGVGELTDRLGETALPDGTGKLTLLRLGAGDWGAPYTVLTAVTGFMLLNLGAYGTDHDLAQRMLTCRSALKGSWSAIAGVLIGVPVAAMFMLLGLLLFVFYRMPEVMGTHGPEYAVGEPKEVFLTFILHEMPRGMSGVMMAGLFAAGIGSLNSAINAMAATLLNDFYRPLRPGRSERHYLLVGRLGVIGWGAVLGLFACVCVWWYKAIAKEGGTTLIDFALGVMGFAYTGLVAVFLTAILTRRGNKASVLGALATGFLVVLALQPAVWGVWAKYVPWTAYTPTSTRAWSLADVKLAYPWHLLIGTVLAMGVCCLGRRERYSAPASAGGAR